MRKSESHTKNRIMQIKTSKRDIIWNCFGIITAMGSNFAILPFLIKFLDGDTLGLWYVYLSIGAIVVLFDFGFNPSLSRNVAYCWSGASDLITEGVCLNNNSGPNYLLLSKLWRTCKRLYLFIALAALLVLFVGGTPYILSISEKIDTNEVIVSWLIYVIAVGFNLFYGYYSTLLRGIGAIAAYNKINVISRWCQIILVVSFLFLGFGIKAVALSYFFYGFILRYLSKKRFFSLIDSEKILNVDVKNSDIVATLKKIWPNAKKDGIIAISAYFSTQAGVFLSSHFFTLEETGYYSISVQIATALATIGSAFYSAYQPAMQSAFVNHDVILLKKMMSFSMLVFSLVYFIGLVFFTLVVVPLFTVLEHSFNLEVSIFLSVAMYIFVYKGQSYYASFISNSNRIPYVYSYLISSILGVVLAFVLLFYFDLGPYGLVLGMFLSQLYNCLKWPLVVRKILKTSWLSFYICGCNQLKEKVMRKK